MTERRVELTRSRRLRALLKWRALQPALELFFFFFLILALLTGFFGTPAGSHNFGMIFVWIVWWALLIIVLVPFFGRAWCAVCPLPAPGEWLQRRAIVRRAPGKLRGLGWRWPRRLRNIWLQNFGFLGVALFSTIILTRPRVTAWALLGMLTLAVLLSVFFKNRVFCRYVCPVGGFIGLYALTSSLELRVRDRQVCKEHGTKECVVGSESGYGCPWMVYPGTLERNAYCGMCTECFKTCSQDNVVLNLRPFGADLLARKGRRLDEAYKALIMLACAIIYNAVLLGPWSWVKDWANMDTLPHWAAYGAGFLTANLLLMPGLFLLTTLVSRTISGLQAPLKRLFVDYAYSLVPMGLAGWIAFCFSFVFVNGSYALSVLSDPFGWGWDLFGTRSVPWTPVLLDLALALQVLMLLVGQVFSIVVAYRIARQHASTDAQAWRGALPVAFFLTGVTLVFLRLYVG